MNVKTISNRSKVGFAYTTCLERVARLSGAVDTVVSIPDYPMYTGTIKQVTSVSNDATLRSIRAGGVCYNSAWFVLVRGKWRRVIGYPNHPDMWGVSLSTALDYFKRLKVLYK